MIEQVAIHWFIEALGGLSLRCALGLCHHRHHQIIAWGIFSILSSIVTVHTVG